MASQVANNFRVLLAQGQPDFSTDVFKMILVAANFVFNPDIHDLYSDVSASELADGFGYTIGGALLSGVVVQQDDVNNVASITWANVSWTAAGGDIGPTSGAIIYDETLINSPIVGFIDFGATYTEVDGGVATIINITVTI